MSKRISETEAKHLMLAANLKPLVPYPGAGVNWKCKCLKCGNEVSPRLASIKRGGGCVYCAGLGKVTPSEAVEILREAQIEPLVGFPGYRKKWKAKCLKCLNEISPSAASVKSGTGCRNCANLESAKKRKLPNEVVIKLMKSRGLEPQEEYPGTHKPWKCLHLTCGNVVTPRYSDIKNGESGCIYCSGKYLNRSKAEATMISNGFLPTENYPGNSKVGWTCKHIKCGNIITVKYNYVQQGKAGCPYCSPNKKLNEDDAVQFFKKHGLIPIEPYVSTQTPWKSIHKKCGNQVSPRFGSVQQGGSGCTYCAGNAKISNDAAKELFFSRSLFPISKYPGANVGWPSIHSICGKKVEPRLADVRAGGGGCAYCGGAKVDAGDAVQLMKNNDFLPQVPYPGADSKWECIHTPCGKLVFPTYVRINRGEGGCAHCSGNAPINPESAIELFRKNGFEPQEPFQGIHHPWKAIHKHCGKLISPRYNAVRRGVSGCKYCSGSKVDPIDAVALFESRGFVPLEPYENSHKPWKCRHLACGKEISPRYADVAHSNGGCKFCATKGIDLTSPAHIYLVTNELLGAHKIGISGENSRRILVHKRNGWDLWDKLLLPTGEAAYSIEQEILSWLREDLELPPYLSSEVMPQGGWSETCDSQEILLPTIWGKVEELSKVRE